MLDSVSITKMVANSLAEDIGSGDISAALLAFDLYTSGSVITRETAVICGLPWVNEVFRQIDPSVKLKWWVRDGEPVVADQVLLTLQGPARSIVSAERCALNWLQTLSGTATITAHYVAQLAGSKVRLLDTRKTLPGLRYAQKYAVSCGGGSNHRMGLYDAYLIKENHIISCGSIAAAISQAQQQQPGVIIEVEVENLVELEQALAAGADIILLDNFTLTGIQQAVAINRGRAQLEVSGNVGLDNLQQVAATGVDRISIGALTKHIQAIDLSLRLQQ